MTTRERIGTLELQVDNLQSQLNFTKGEVREWQEIAACRKHMIEQLSVCRDDPDMRLTGDEMVRRLTILTGDLKEFGRHDAACPAVCYANQAACICGLTSALKHASNWLAEESSKRLAISNPTRCPSDDPDMRVLGDSLDRCRNKLEVYRSVMREIKSQILELDKWEEER